MTAVNVHMCVNYCKLNSCKLNSIYSHASVRKRRLPFGAYVCIKSLPKTAAVLCVCVHQEFTCAHAGLGYDSDNCVCAHMLSHTHVCIQLFIVSSDQYCSSWACCHPHVHNHVILSKPNQPKLIRRPDP